MSKTFKKPDRPKIKAPKKEKVEEAVSESFLANEKKQENKKALNFDEIMDTVGGFGRMQWYATVCIILAYMSGGQIVYGLPFLVEIFPNYECLKYYKEYESYKWETCTRKSICDDSIPTEQWRINYNESNSYTNWVDPLKLDLTCVNEHVITLCGGFYFLGFAVSCVFVPRAADLVGRKYPFIISMMFQTLAYLLLIFSRNIYFTIFCYWFVGMCAAGRMIVGVLYLCEFIAEKYHWMVITALFCFDGFTMVLQATFYSIWHDWRFLHLFGILSQFALLFLLGWIPESPKYYYSNRMFLQFRESLYFISYFNNIGITMEEIDEMKFETEVATFAKFSKKITKAIEETKASEDQDKDEEDEEKESTAILTQDKLDDDEPERIKLTGEIGQILQVKELKMNMIVIAILLSVSSFKFYMIDMQIQRELGDIISNTYYNQFSEITAALVAGLLYVSIGPKFSLFMCYSLSIFGTLLLFLYSENQRGSELCFTIIKFGISASFVSLYLCAIDKVPTVYAASVFGWCNTIARIFTILAVDPTIEELQYPEPLIINLLLGIVAILVCTRLYENMPLFQ